MADTFEIGKGVIGEAVIGETAEGSPQTVVVTPVVITLTAVSPTISLGGINRAATPVVMTLTPVTPTFHFFVTATPVVMTLTPVTPVVSSSGTVSRSASPVVLTLTVSAGSLGAHSVAASPVLMMLAVPAASGATGATAVVATPVLLRLRVRTPTQESLAQPCDFSLLPITVGCVLDNVFRQCGLVPADYDVSAAIDEVDTVTLTDRQAGESAIDAMLRVYQTLLVEIDGKIIAVKRGGAVVATLTERDLGWRLFARDSSPDPKREFQRTQPIELPVAMDISYFAASKDYQIGSQRALRHTKPNQEVEMLTTNLALTDNFARQAIEYILSLAYLEREPLKIAVPIAWAWLAPGDSIYVPVPGNTLQRFRIVQQDFTVFGQILCRLVPEEVSVLTQTISGAALPANTDALAILTDTLMVAWSTNALRDVDAPAVGLYVAVGPPTTGDWPGCLLYMSLDGGLSYEALEVANDAAAIGEASTILASPPANVGTAMWDYVSTVDVTITCGEVPASASAAEVLNGTNAAMLGDEVIAFMTVTALGGSSYRLSNLLRGRRGTESYCGTHLVGDRFVQLDASTVVRLTLSDALFNKNVMLKAVTGGTAIADATPDTILVTGNELKPYAATSLSGARNLPSSNDWTFAWIPRTRASGQWADGTTPPVGESPEAYEIDVMNGASVVRTLTASSPTVVYTAAQQTTDFGSAQSTLTFRVYEMGKFGRGYRAEQTVTG
jgi:hypothetical protein